jgi:hypothetical protein
MSNFNVHFGIVDHGAKEENDSDDEYQHIPGNHWLSSKKEKKEDRRNDELHSTYRRQPCYRKTTSSPLRARPYPPHAPKCRASTKKHCASSVFQNEEQCNNNLARRLRQGPRSIDHTGRVRSIESTENSQRYLPRCSICPCIGSRQKLHTVSSNNKDTSSPSSHERVRREQSNNSPNRHHQKEHRQPYEKTTSRPHHSTFIPKRSMDIHRAFNHHNNSSGGDIDIWVECIVMHSPNRGGVHKCFKSLFTGERRHEPPTGATIIIYLEDVVEEYRQPKVSKPTAAPRQVTRGLAGSTPNTDSSKNENNAIAKNPKKQSLLCSLFGGTKYKKKN